MCSVKAPSTDLTHRMHWELLVMPQAEGMSLLSPHAQSHRQMTVVLLQFDTPIQDGAQIVKNSRLAMNLTKSI